MVHLHLHTSLGSRLDAIPTSEEYAKKAHKFGHKAMAVTDHGRMSAVYEHQQACLKYDIKPILGVEAYLVDELISLNDKDKRTRTKTNHAVLLAKNEIGYKNLLKLNYISMVDKDHYYYVNRITKEELFENKEGIIVGTACLGSKWNRLIIAGEIEEAEKLFKEFKDEFGEDFYAEVQLNEMTWEIEKAKEGQKTVNSYILQFAKKYDVMVYIGGDVHYLNPGEDQLQSISIAIRNKETMDALSWEIESRNLYYHNEDDYVRFNTEFGYNYDEELIHQWCDNSDKIADKCNYMIPERNKIYLPSLYIDDDAELVRRSREGLKNKFESPTKEYIDRLNHELEIIIRKGFSSYLLILEDVFEYVQEEDLWMGAGRGSGAGSLILFVLGITTIDPIKYDLLFERFMSDVRSIDMVYNYFGE